MSGAGTKFVSLLGDTLELENIWDINGNTATLRVYDTSDAAYIDLNSDDIDRLIETLHRIQEELNS